VQAKERLLTAEPWVEREVQLPLSGCNLGKMGGARRSNHILILPLTLSLQPLDPQRWSWTRSSWTSFGSAVRTT